MTQTLLISARFKPYDPYEGAGRFWLCERHMKIALADLGSEIIVDSYSHRPGTCDECLRERKNNVSDS